MNIQETTTVSIKLFVVEMRQKKMENAFILVDKFLQ